MNTWHSERIDWYSKAKKDADKIVKDALAKFRSEYRKNIEARKKLKYEHNR